MFDPVVVSIQCSIHAVPVLVRSTSYIKAHFFFGKMVYDWPVQLKIAKHMRRLFCIKMDAVDYSSNAKIFYF
jgi:hypothetical protein